jgi:hypothetical protein
MSVVVFENNRRHKERESGALEVLMSRVYFLKNNH